MNHNTGSKYKIGMRIGHIIIIDTERDAKNRLVYICRCDCGNICRKNAGQISKAARDHSGDNCGCMRKTPWEVRHMRVGSMKTYVERMQAWRERDKATKKPHRGDDIHDEASPDALCRKESKA